MTRQHKPTGADRVLEQLRRGYWLTAAEIEERCDVTCHSRISELRGLGHTIDKRRNPGATGRRKFSYRLIATAEQMRDAREASLGDTVEQAMGAVPVSPSDERSRLHHGAWDANGDSSEEGERAPSSSEPADELEGFTDGVSTSPYHDGECGSAAALRETPAAADPADEEETGDALWRDRFLVLDETLPPPVEQLELGVGS